VPPSEGLAGGPSGGTSGATGNVGDDKRLRAAGGGGTVNVTTEVRVQDERDIGQQVREALRRVEQETTQKVRREFERDLTTDGPI